MFSIRRLDDDGQTIWSEANRTALLEPVFHSHAASISQQEVWR